VQSSDLKTANNAPISAEDLERHFEAGLRHFKELLSAADNEGKGNLIDLLAAASEEIASARQ
tara:strand:+ start:269 stop:454 length:186 start_codon:yes stop_codon:yes gene_type:complete